MTGPRPPFFDRLQGWWDSLASPGRPPHRDAVAPIEIMPMLPHLVMVDLTGLAPRVLWAGTAVKEMLGGDPAGLAIDQTPFADDHVADAFGELVGAGRPLDAVLGGRRMLLCPLAGDDGAITTVLAGVAPTAV